MAASKTTKLLILGINGSGAGMFNRKHTLGTVVKSVFEGLNDASLDWSFKDWGKKLKINAEVATPSVFTEAPRTLLERARKEDEDGLIVIGIGDGCFSAASLVNQLASDRKNKPSMLRVLLIEPMGFRSWFARITNRGESDLYIDNEDVDQLLVGYRQGVASMLNAKVHPPKGLTEESYTLAVLPKTTRKKLAGTREVYDLVDDFICHAAKDFSFKLK